MSLLDVRPDWFDQAACRGRQNEWFKDVDGGSYRDAKRVCWTECPVREECYEYAASLVPLPCWGVWGGESWHPNQRRQHLGLWRQQKGA